MSTLRRVMWFICCALLNFNVLQAGAQEITWDEFVEQITNPEDESNYSLDYLIDELCYLHEHPININQVSTEVLQKLPFLHAEQIEAIEAYVYMHGPVLSMGELNLIPELDYRTRQWLTLFITIGDPLLSGSKLYFKKLVHSNKQELLLKTSIPFYSLDEKYKGPPLSHSLRYQFRYDKKLEWGLTADQDAGEPFFQGINKKGYDHYSYYLIAKNLGKLKTLALGHYRLNFGQGLVLNSSFSLGKLSTLTQYDYDGYKGIVKHSSTSEYGYFQGAAAQFSWNKWSVYGFVSYKHSDATLQGDSLISTLITDGYHRTETEIKKKNNIYNWLIGGNITYNISDFHIGLTSIYTVFNKMFRTYEAPHYKAYYPAGPAFSNTSIEYGFKSYHFSVKGELAFSQNGGLATLHTVQYRPSSRWTYQALYRYYHPRYISWFGQSFGESSNVNNENGLYLGMVYKPMSMLQFASYVDIFEFPWAKYQATALHSKGIDWLAQIQYTPKAGWDIQARYRVKVKQKNYTPSSSAEKTLANVINQSARLQVKYPFTFLKAHTQVYLSWYRQADLPAEKGIGISQQMVWQIPKPSMELSLFGMYFCTDSYNSRVYGYEKNMLYSFSYPSYYGKGIRLSSTFRVNLNENILFFFKYGQTFYLNMDKSTQNNLQIQMRVKF